MWRSKNSIEKWDFAEYLAIKIGGVWLQRPFTFLACTSKGLKEVCFWDKQKKNQNSIFPLNATVLCCILNPSKLNCESVVLLRFMVMESPGRVSFIKLTEIFLGK